MILPRLRLIARRIVWDGVETPFAIHIMKIAPVRIVFAEMPSVVVRESRVTVLLGKWIVAEMGPALLSAVLQRCHLTVRQIVFAETGSAVSRKRIPLTAV